MDSDEHGSPGEARVYLLTGHDFASWASLHATGSVPGRYPYSADMLKKFGLTVDYPAIRSRLWRTGPSKRLVDALEFRLDFPLLDPLRAYRQLRKADYCMCLFEDQAVIPSIYRRLKLLRPSKPKLVVVACWLSEHLIAGSPLERTRYIRWLQQADLILCFSRNQVDILSQRLGFDSARVMAVPFAVDIEFFNPRYSWEDGYVFAAGGDRARDYVTFASALRDWDQAAKVIAWRFTTTNIDWPPTVELLGSTDHVSYRHHLGGASVVVVPTYPVAYPSGQTVLLEAMAMGKACVATDSPATRDYIDHGRTGLLVPPGNPLALREACEQLRSDPTLRSRLGAAAMNEVHTRWTPDHMWRAIAERLQSC